MDQHKKLICSKDIKYQILLWKYIRNIDKHKPQIQTLINYVLLLTL